MLYLDNAATTPVRPEVLEAMLPFLTTRFGNPSSHHTVGEGAAEALSDARTRVATTLGMRPGDIVFTSGGTEANNLALKGIGIAAMLHSGAQHLITTPIEHESILESADYLARVHGFEVTSIPVDGFGRLDPDEVAAAVRADTALIAFGYANNEVGTVQDTAAISVAVRAVAPRLPLHIDAVQAAGWLPLDAASLGVDAIALAGHKLGAPKGSGVLAVRGRIPWSPCCTVAVRSAAAAAAPRMSQPPSGSRRRSSSPNASARNRPSASGRSAIASSHRSSARCRVHG